MSKFDCSHWRWYGILLATDIEFKVLDPDEDEKTLEDILTNARTQIEEKQYEAELISAGFAPDQICKYGFAYKGT